MIARNSYAILIRTTILQATEFSVLLFGTTMHNLSERTFEKRAKERK